METTETKLSAKEIVAQLMKQLPDDCTLEDFQYHLYLFKKIELGLKDIEEGRFFTQEEMEQQAAEWARE